MTPKNEVRVIFMLEKIVALLEGMAAGAPLAVPVKVPAVRGTGGGA